MAVRTREEILEAIRTIVGEATDDNTISFIEDVSDTLTDLETKAKCDGEDWEQKYRDNDENWRKKYTERFFSTPDTEPDIEPEPEPEPEPEKKTFADLFKED